jgi:predicted nucleic acid-binding protein
MSARVDSSKNWLEAYPKEAFAIPGVVAMELVIGRRSQADLQQIRTFLGSFSIAWPNDAEFAQAYELLATHRLSGGIGIPDCLIAARALPDSIHST